MSIIQDENLKKSFITKKGPGFRPLIENRHKCLLLVGWVEVRNPTFQSGLNPTYLKPDFSFRHYLRMKMRNTEWKIQLNLLGAIIRKNILEYRRYPLEIAFTFLMPIVWFLPTYFLDLVRVHTLAINPLVPYGLELFIFLAASLLFPIGGVWFFNYIDRKCRILGSLHVY